MEDSRLNRRKSSEIELSAIFKAMSTIDRKVEDHPDHSKNSKSPTDVLNHSLDVFNEPEQQERMYPSPRRTMSAPSPLPLDQNGNIRTGDHVIQDYNTLSYP